MISWRSHPLFKELTAFRGQRESMDKRQLNKAIDRFAEIIVSQNEAIKDAKAIAESDDGTIEQVRERLNREYG